MGDARSVTFSVSLSLSLSLCPSLVVFNGLQLVEICQEVFLQDLRYINQVQQIPGRCCRMHRLLRQEKNPHLEV